MRIAKHDVPIKINGPGAVARQQTGFGDASGCGAMGGEHFQLAAGADLAPLLEGLDGDLCQAPHWGYLISGELTVTYQNGESERLTSGDLLYWPPGHTVKVHEDSELVLFSPQHQHTPVLDHIARKMAGELP